MSLKAEDWRRMKDVIIARLDDILKPLLTKDWTPEINRQANRMIEKEMPSIAQHLDFPALPEGHEYRCELRLRTQDGGTRVKLNLKHQFKRTRMKAAAHG